MQDPPAKAKGLERKPDEGLRMQLPPTEAWRRRMDMLATLETRQAALQQAIDAKKAEGLQRRPGRGLGRKPQQDARTGDPASSSVTRPAKETGGNETALGFGTKPEEEAARRPEMRPDTEAAMASKEGWCGLL